MRPKASRKLVLTESQAGCLMALRDGKQSNPAIAMRAKLDLKRTATGLIALAGMGLARRDKAKKWHATGRGKACRFETVPDRTRRDSMVPGPGARRLLQLLDRPIRGSEIGGRLGVSHQRVRQLLIKLHAQGLVSFGDPVSPFWMVMRVGDQTPLLSRDEERVLSAIPANYATSATKIRLAVAMPENKSQRILEDLKGGGFVDAFEGPQGNRLYRLTAAGLKHPQRDQFARQAKPLRPSVESDRVRKVLSAITDSGALRIRDVTEALGIPHRSINALMQYLKRKQLVRKTGQELTAPYCLTDDGQAALAEMTRRRAA